MKKSAWALVISCSIQIQLSYAQDFPTINFSLLSTATGLPTNFITQIFKDSRGLIWLGTEYNGLLRYDGKNTKSYHGANTTGAVINSKYVGVICEDKKGWLWISTMEGLYHFNPISEQAEAYQHNENDSNSVATNEKPMPYVDNRGRIWITGSNGLQQFNAETKKFINYYTPPISNPAWRQLEKSVSWIMEDSQHRLWATSAYGLYLVDTITRLLHPYYTGLYRSITGIIEDNQNQLLVSFWGGGIKAFDPLSKVYKDIYKPTTVIQSLTKWEDATGKTWLLFFDDNLLTLLDPVTKNVHTYPADNTIGNNIKGKYVTCIYIDNEKRAWISTDAGINIIDRNAQQFNNYRLYKNLEKNGNYFGDPRAILKNDDEYLITPWARKFIYQFDKNWNHLNPIDNFLPKGTSQLSYIIHTIQKDELNNIWYGTDSGLIKQTGNNYKLYLPPDSFARVDYQFSARDILKRSDDKYWVRFPGRGLYVFNPAKEQFEKKYLHQENGQNNCMTYDKTGQLWLGTEEGLYTYNPSLDVLVQVPITHPNKLLGKYYNTITNIFFDENNTGWLGTKYGLLKMEAGTQKIEYINDPARPLTYTVYRQLQDAARNIWMLSDAEIISYNKISKSFRYFSSANGLPEGFQGFPGVFNWIDSNTIAVGSTNTITTFNPYQLITNSCKANLLFTDIIIDGLRIPFSRKNDSSITISAGARNINLHFALLNYAASQQNKLYYRLSSFKKDEWITTTDGDITLVNLPPGNYTLQIKGESNGDKKSVTTDEITIHVKPYWYQSILFKLLAILAIGVLTYFFVRWRINAIQASASLKQKISETEMASLKAQMNPHFMFNCINSIDAFIHSNDKYNATLYLNKFAKLLRNILDSSKQNTVALTKDIETLKLYIELEELRNENKFKSIINIDEELLTNDYKVPPLIIQPFVENAILHGLKNKEGNYGLLQVTIKKAGRTIQYSIADNGIGREAAGKIPQSKESSYGMTISFDRIKLFNKEKTPSVTITDLYDKSGIVNGTLVTVKLKLV